MIFTRTQDARQLQVLLLKRAQVLGKLCLLVDIEGRVLEGDRVQEQQLVQHLLAVLRLGSAHPPHVADAQRRQGVVQAVGAVGVARLEQRHVQHQLPPGVLLRQRPERGHVIHVVGVALVLPELVEVPLGQELQACAQEAELERQAEVQQAAQQVHALAAPHARELR